ncbi:MAG: transcriptional repressor NrdR, partial [Lachnospiraceae bacterium]|nr:transcriptional repressor NrdR [Lachnospiraceae bacterium]
MKCPYCSKDDTRVIDSRPVEENNSIRRRRICDSCGRRFTTYEKIETIPMIVIKKDNNRETYDRSKIEAGILRACHKRPVSASQIKKTVDEIEAEIFEREEKEILSTEIGEMVMRRI